MGSDHGIPTCDKCLRYMPMFYWSEPLCPQCFEDSPRQKRITALKKAYARFRRFIYLTFIGLWQGERAVDFRDDKKRTTLIGSGIERAPGVYKPLHVWWKRQQ